MEEEQSSTSVILHVDLDCFYAAVEHSRLSIPFEKPLAVQQWEGLIAVNYAARAAGIVRHDRVSDALRKCPDLQLVHVETIGNDKGDGIAARRDTSKVSLERYRQASRRVFDIFHLHADICERASIDEAYLDVTNKVETIMKEGRNWGEDLHCLLGGADRKAGMVIESGSFDLCDPFNRRLLAGAVIAERIRTDVRSKLGYTCSVGIATNKLLAKIASARNKPDQQTLILPEAVADLMDALPLKKVKLLGGKIGEELSEKWSCQTAGDAQKVPLKSLLASFGDRLGNYVYKAIRGIHEDKVQEKQTTKSMLAAKSFQATSDVSVIRMWLGVLADELSVRMLRDAKENHRHPHNLQLYYRSGMSRQSGDHSKSCSMPHTVIQLLASARMGTSALKHQPDDFEAPSRKCQSSNTLKDVVKVREVNDSDSATPVCNYHKEDEADGELPTNKADYDFHDEKTKTMFTPGHVRNMDGKNGTEDEQKVKDLSKLLQQASFQLFQRLEDAFPCTRLAIAASGFQSAPAQGSQSIQRFFGHSSDEPAMPSSDSPTGFVGENKLVNKHKGLRKYFDDDTCAKQSYVPLYEREDIEQTMHDETSQGTEGENYESSDHQNANYSRQKPGHEATVKPQLNLPKSFKCLGGSMNQQGNSTPTDVDLKDIDVNEQRCILNEIEKARTHSEAGGMPLKDNLIHDSEKQAIKRRKSKTSDTKSGQLSLSNFFHS